MVLPLDMPDDYPWLPGSGKAQVGDLGELAVRLGSPVSYDRRGAVYWFDEFESGLSPWLIQLGGTGSSVVIVNAPTFSGDMSCQITGGSDGAERGGIVKRLAPALLTTYGLEFTFSVKSDVERVFISFQYNDATKRYVGAFQANVVDAKISYLDDTYAWADLQAFVIADDDEHLFYTFKLVVDMVSKKYVRVMINQTEIDISDKALYSTADVTVPRIEIAIYVVNDTGDNGICFVDNAVVTVGDP